MTKKGHLTENTVSEITEKVGLILNQYEMFEPPVDYKRIVSLEKLNYEQFDLWHPEYQKFSKQIGEERAATLRGVLIVPEKQLFIRDDGYNKRINYARGHELGHWFLSWHNELLYHCSEFDLSYATRIQMEMEANYFSKTLGFMNGLFNTNLADCNLSMQTIKNLSDRYDLSVESCLRAAVEDEQRSCALIVMNYSKNQAGNYVFKTAYSYQSGPFTQRLGGKIKFNEIFEAGHEMTKIMNDENSNFLNSYTFDGYVANKHNRNDKVHVDIEVWKNNYKAFALIVPRNVPIIS